MAFAKRKRLPVAICTWVDGRLVPEPLGTLSVEPPRGSGNAKVLDQRIVDEFADETANYLTQVCSLLGIRLERIAIDAPSSPRRKGTERRAADAAMDRAGISCFTTPSASEFDQIFEKVEKHLSAGGPENRIPHANQLWMVVGFSVFSRLTELAPCVEVFPQATARVLGSGQVHKFKSGGVEAQLAEAATHTGWPTPSHDDTAFEDIAFGPAHDRLDAYLSAWVAALPEERRIPFGNPPNDVIWAPKVGAGVYERPTVPRKKERNSAPRRTPGVLHDERFRRVCPACKAHTFARWPFGWDSHAAHKCTGLAASGPAARKAEFKERFGDSFRPDT